MKEAAFIRDSFTLKFPLSESKPPSFTVSGSKSWFISSLGGKKVPLEKDGYGWIIRLNKEKEVIATRRLLKISKKGQVTEVISGFNQFADLGIDQERGIIMIPEMSKNRFIMVYLDDL